MQGELSSISKADEADLCYVTAYAYMLLITNVYHSSQGKEDQNSFCPDLFCRAWMIGLMLQPDGISVQNCVLVFGKAAAKPQPKQNM